MTDALAGIDAWPVPHAAAGVTDARAALEVRGGTGRRFPLASVTKVHTAVAVWVAIEGETVGLGEPAGPEGATVRHLLSHASGLGYERDDRPVDEPGRLRAYSNAGFEVLAEVVADRSAMAFEQYLAAAVVAPLGPDATHLDGSPAHGATSTVEDLLALGRELLAPTLLAPSTLTEATTEQFPGLGGVLPGYGRQEPNPWGLGVELRGGKSPHWTGGSNSPATFGHFGRSGTFLWVDPVAGLACAVLTDRTFGDWAIEAWPPLSDDVLAAHRR